MAQATYFNTAKRRNSTLVPSSGTEATLHLKEATSLLNPTFLLSANTVPAISEILFMGRYYFVDNIRSVRNGVWEIDCSVDVLATYKSQILAQSAFVKYSSSINDPYVIDDRIQRQVKSVITNAGSSGTLPRYSETRKYILQVISDRYSSIGGFVTTYLLTQEQLSELSAEFFSDESLKTELEKYFTNYFDCIISCYATNWIPFTYEMHPIYLGNFESSVSASTVADPITTEYHTVNIPWPFDDFRRSDCSLKLLLPYVGMVELSASEYFSQDSIDIDITTDWNSGNIFYTIGANITSEAIGRISTYVGNAYTQIPISRYGVEGGAAIAEIGFGIIGDIYTRAAQAMSGRFLTENPSIIEQAGYDMLRGISKSTPSIIGGFGNMAMCVHPTITCYLTYNPRGFEPNDANANALYGRPYYKAVSSLSNLTGFLQCAGFSFSGNCTDRERVTVNNLMDGGIYIE